MTAGALTLGFAEAPSLVFTAAAHGSAGARERIFAEYFEGVYAFVRMAVPDAGKADDLAVDALITAIERCGDCPVVVAEVDPWLRGVALEHLAPVASAAAARTADPSSASSARVARLRHTLDGVSDSDLAILVRSLEPIRRQAVVLGLMSELEDAVVGRLIGVPAEQVAALQADGLAEIDRLVSRYDNETHQIGILAQRAAPHLRPMPGPTSNGMMVVRGDRMMLENGPSSGFLYMAMKAFERIMELLHFRHETNQLDDDVGEINTPRPIKRTAGGKQFARPQPTPSMTDYRMPTATPGMAGYRQPKGTPSTARLSSPARTARASASAFGGMRNKF